MGLPSRQLRVGRVEANPRDLLDAENVRAMILAANGLDRAQVARKVAHAPIAQIKDKARRQKANECRLNGLGRARSSIGRFAALARSFVNKVFQGDHGLIHGAAPWPRSDSICDHRAHSIAK